MTFSGYDEHCVESLGSCETLCASTTGCKGIAFAANPPESAGHVGDAKVVCAQVQKARCVNLVRHCIYPNLTEQQGRPVLHTSTVHLCPASIHRRCAVYVDTTGKRVGGVMPLGQVLP